MRFRRAERLGVQPPALRCDAEQSGRAADSDTGVPALRSIERACDRAVKSMGGALAP